MRTLFVLWQAKVAVPARHKHHIIRQVLTLDLELLHNDNVGLENVEHGIVGPLVAPWLVAERVADAVDIPCRDADHYVQRWWLQRRDGNTIILPVKQRRFPLQCK
jgi:hypothetical protein